MIKSRQEKTILRLPRDEDGRSLADVDQTRRAISENAQALIFKSNDWELAKIQSVLVYK